MKGNKKPVKAELPYREDKGQAGDFAARKLIFVSG